MINILVRLKVELASGFLISCAMCLATLPKQKLSEPTFTISSNVTTKPFMISSLPSAVILVLKVICLLS